ncbi:MAP7 domain-containing protein 1-like [Microplitis mediator]|uniref:MAP7 domain-containing protein 1-like n=1 Tax=Microplitis mediator TaxID=375433 RepID=UPI002557BAE2|nr:MAP7 domain-containing protein 1-like [Microplitis mediator]
MKWNYIFASCFIAALLLDQTSAGRWGSRSRTRTSSRSSGSSRSPSPPGSPSRHRPSSTEVTHYDPANSHFSRPQSPPPGSSPSSAGSSRRSSHVPLSHSSSTSSGYFSSNSPHSPHPPGTSSPSPASMNPFQRMQSASHRQNSPPRPSSHPDPSSQSLPRGIKPSSRPTSPSRHHNTADHQHETEPHGLHSRPRSVKKRDPSRSLNAVEALEFEASLVKSFAVTHKEVISKDKNIKGSEKKQKQLVLKKVNQKVLDNESKKKKAEEETPVKRKTLDDVSLVRDKNKKCGHQGSTTESCFDFYTFTMTWAPASVRSARKLKTGNVPKEDEWIVHGLWPNVKGNLPAPPKACDVQKMHFDLRKLQGIKRVLHERWYSVVSDNEVFWEHEWEKHGACAARSIFINDIEGYFKKGISLGKTIKFKEILHQAGFGPGSTMTLQQIYDTISHHYGTPEITTWKDVTQADDITYLKEIRVCLNHRFKYMSCPMKPPHPDVLAQEISYLSITEAP